MEIPNWLKNSMFIDEINPDDNFVLDYHYANIPNTSDIYTFDDFINVFNAINFFGRKEIPISFYFFIFLNKEKVIDFLNEK